MRGRMRSSPQQFLGRGLRYPTAAGVDFSCPRSAAKEGKKHATDADSECAQRANFAYLRLEAAVGVHPFSRTTWPARVAASALVRSAVQRVAARADQFSQVGVPAGLRCADAGGRCYPCASTFLPSVFAAARRNDLRLSNRTDVVPAQDREQIVRVHNDRRASQTHVAMAAITARLELVRIRRASREDGPLKATIATPAG